MLRMFSAIAVIFTCIAFAIAQDTHDTEVFAGFSVLRTDYKAADPILPPQPVITAFEGGQTLYGFNASITRYIRSGFGITGDFSYHTTTIKDPSPLGGTIDTKISVYNILAGPQYKFRRSKSVSPFVHALAGVAHTKVRISGTGIGSDSDGTTDFAMAFGGGVDVRVNDRIAIRAIQADYNPIFLRGPALGFKGPANNFRISFGVVFR
jgi:opacity protein-like surface antigen